MSYKDEEEVSEAKDLSKGLELIKDIQVRDRMGFDTYKVVNWEAVAELIGRAKVDSKAIANISVADAMARLRLAMVEDGNEPGSYAHSWHCNIAMMCYDAMMQSYGDGHDHHAIANDAASRFMKMAFQVETKG